MWFGPQELLHHLKAGVALFQMMLVASEKRAEHNL